MSGTDTSPEKDPVEETDLVDQASEAALAADGEPSVDNETLASGNGSLQTALEKALEEVEKFKDLALRSEAEMQNVRRRAERDVESAHKYGIEKFLLNLLPVVDSLEKAVEAANEARGDADREDAVLEGVRLCLKMFHDVMAKEKVEVVDPHGEPFNPQEHEAMTLVEHQEMEPNSVVTVIQKGYKLNERLVRPAMVVVSKAAEKPGGE